MPPGNGTLLSVGRDGLYGNVDTATWQVVIPLQYANAMPFGEGLMAVTKDEKHWYFVDRQGNQVVDYKFQFGDTHHEGLATAKERDRWGYIDTTGRYAIEPRYAMALDFEDGVADVTTRGLFGTSLFSRHIKIDKRGEEIKGGLINKQENSDKKE